MARAKWSIPIGPWVQRAKGDLRKAARMIALELFSKIIVRSPVDTGRFRGNWMIGIAIIPIATRAEGFGPSRSDGGEGGGLRGANASAAYGVAIQQIANLGGYSLGQTISFRNTLPYAVKLEKGWSGQAPQGVVKVTVMEFGGVVRSVARRVRNGG